jgi:hypothetical protein
LTFTVGKPDYIHSHCAERTKIRLALFKKTSIKRGVAISDCALAYLLILTMTQKRLIGKRMGEYGAGALESPYCA